MATPEEKKRHQEISEGNKPEGNKHYQLQVSKLTDDSYPGAFVSEHQRISIEDFIIKYSNLEPNQENGTVYYSIWGRTHTQRPAGKHIIFIDLVRGDQKLQVMVWDQEYYDQQEFKKLCSTISRGDIIGLEGYPYKTKQGELSIRATKIQILTPCLQQIPKKFSQKTGEKTINAEELSAFFGFSDKEKRFRERYLDLVINDEVYRTLMIRSQLIAFLRFSLINWNFLELETPVLNMIAGGASATPFVTHHNDLNTGMYLRIATELPLKMAVVGGFEKVFELGRVFRNEGIDSTHNPEFTSLELYQADANHETMMMLIETMLPKLAYHFHGQREVPYQDKVINWDGPYRRIDIMTFLTEKFPDFPKIDSPSLTDDLKQFCVDNDVPMPAAQTSAKFFDKIIGKFIEPLCQDPTFICGHPVIMSPLAKPDKHRPGLTERFELFVAGMEIANGFSELNDPRIQLKNFEDQMAQKLAGDTEAQGVIDTNYIKALEIGLPPCGGLGIGIDRLVMFMTNQSDIREVIMFPTMK